MKGSEGPRVPTRTSVLSGTTAPPASTGAPGDFYIQIRRRLTRKVWLTYSVRMADGRDAPRPDGFAALAHPARRQILDLLAEGERSVGGIAAHFAISRPAVSQHLRVLLAAGLVSERRRGRERRYRLRPEGMREAYDWLAHYRRFWDERLGRLTRHLAKEDDP